MGLWPLSVSSAVGQSPGGVNSVAAWTEVTPWRVTASSERGTPLPARAAARLGAWAPGRLGANDILGSTATRITYVVRGGGPRGYLGLHGQAAANNDGEWPAGGDPRSDAGLTGKRGGRVACWDDVLGHGCSRMRPRRPRHPGKVRDVADGSGRRPTTGRRAIPRSRSRRRRARSRAHRGRRCRASG